MSNHKKKNVNEREEDLVKIKLKEAYGIDVHSVCKLEDGYKIYTEDKKYKLEMTTKSTAEWLFSKTIYQHLIKNGFNKIISVEINNYGEIVTDINKQGYVLKAYSGFRTFKFYDEGSCEKLVDFMCSFDKAAGGCSPESGTRVQVSWGKLLLKSKNCAIGMKRFISKARANGASQDFDKLIIKYGKTYLQQTQEAYRMLKESNYINMVEESMRKSQLCMGSFSGKRLMTKDSELYLMYMDRCCYDISCTDVARVIIKCIDNPLWCKNFINTYLEKNQLSQDELLVIYCMILGNDEIYKLCKRYYDTSDISNKQEITIKLANLIECGVNNSDVLYYIENLMKRGELNEYI